ncbi:MAG TPA: VCBS repeat-containing protein [Polyangiaceae bacterium]|nr:VCBS repeat-containing protein [Polyangiaceae bacterium]
MNTQHVLSSSSKSSTLGPRSALRRILGALAPALMLVGASSAFEPQAAAQAASAQAAPAPALSMELWSPEYGYNDGWRVDANPRLIGDVNGDMLDDVVGFGPMGVEVSLSTGDSFETPKFWVLDYTVAQGWSSAKHVRVLADVNGDGRKDIVAFGNGGTYVSLSTGKSFYPAQLWIADYGYDGSWRLDLHVRLLADVNGDMMDDIVAFGTGGTYVSLSTGAVFRPPQLWVKDYGYNAGGWRVEQHERRLADVNGDGLKDVVGFGTGGTYVSLNTGKSFLPPKVWVSEYGYDAGGWRVDKHPRFLADVNGDMKDDVVGFGPNGTYVSLSTGSFFTPAEIWIADFGFDVGGWRLDKHPRFLADMDGDGMSDVVGIGYGGVVISKSTGHSFASPTLAIANYGFDAGGWRVDQHPRLLADVDGDNTPDVVGFGGAGTYVTLTNPYH